MGLERGNGQSWHVRGGGFDKHLTAKVNTSPYYGRLYCPCASVSMITTIAEMTTHSSDHNTL